MHADYASLEAAVNIEQCHITKQASVSLMLKSTAPTGLELSCLSDTSRMVHSTHHWVAGDSGLEVCIPKTSLIQCVSIMRKVACIGEQVNVQSQKSWLDSVHTHHQVRVAIPLIAQEMLFCLSYTFLHKQANGVWFWLWKSVTDAKTHARLVPDCQGPNSLP